MSIAARGAVDQMATPTVLAALGCWLAAAGSRLWLVREFSTNMPVGDQWSGELRDTLLPWVEGRFDLAQLFVAHNEHHLATMRALEIALYEAAHGFDPELGMMASALIHASFFSLLGWWLGRGQPVGAQVGLFTASAYLACLPLDWDVALSSFNVQWELLGIFALLALASWVGARALSQRWWMGFAFALLAIASMASGLLVAVAGVVPIALSAWTRQAASRNQAVALAILLLTAAAAYFWMPQIENHDALRAHSLGEWLTSFSRTVAWPWIGAPALAPFSYAPLLLLAIQVVRRKEEPSFAQTFTLAVAALSVLQIAAIAFGRGAGGIGPAPRYIDLILPGALANLSALLLLLRTRTGDSARKWLLFGCLWLAIMTAGVLHRAPHALAQIRVHHQTAVRVGDLVRQYISKGHDGIILEAPSEAFPFGVGREYLLGVLKHPGIVELLPENARGPELIPHRQRVLLRAADEVTEFAIGLLVAAIAWAALQKPSQPMRSRLSRA